MSNSAPSDTSPIRWKLPLVLTLLFHILLTQGWLGTSFVSDPPGPRQAKIIYESKNVSPVFDDTLRLLHTGPIYDQLKQEGDTVVIFDKDAKDENGNPSPIVAEAKKVLGDIPLPAIIVINPSTKHVTYKGSLYDIASRQYLTADQISKLIN